MLAALAGEMAGLCVFISGEDLATCALLNIWLKHLTVTNPAVCHDKVVNQQCAVYSGLPHNDDSSP